MGSSVPNVWRYTVESDYERRMRETLAALSGGKVTEMPARPVEAPPDMTAADMQRAVQLSGTHEIRHTMRGSWEPRPPIDWSKAGWLRDERGRFAPLTIVEIGHD
jgi:hypothetical protein